MGGNYIHTKFGFPKKRLGVEEFNSTTKKIINQLNDEISGLHYIVPFYSKKDSFGDCDILSTATPDQLLSFAQKYGDKNLAGRNTSVISFPYNGFQIDLISVDKIDFDIALTYLSYNDLGNFIGRIAHKFGLKYGHKGLFIPIRTELFDETLGRDDSHILDEICLTKNPREIFNLLGFNYDRFQQGFESLEDIFEYVSQSFYFDPDIYNLDNVNHKARIRDKKRDSYNKLLNWLQEKKPEAKFKFSKNKRQYQVGIIAKFPNAELQINKIYLEYKKREDIKKKLNFLIIQDILPDKEIKEISKILLDIKQRYSSIELLIMDSNTIKEKIKEYGN